MQFNYQGYSVDIYEESDRTRAEPPQWIATVRGKQGTVYQTACYPTQEMAQADATAWIDGRIRPAS